HRGPGVQALEGEVRSRLSPELEGDLVGISAESLGQDEEKHRGDPREGQADPEPPPPHAAAPGLRASFGAGRRSGAPARTRRRSGQAAKRAPKTKSGRLHQIHPTIGKIQALKLAEGGA